MRRFIEWMSRRNALPVDPFGDPGPDPAAPLAATDLGGHRFAWIANRL